MQLTKTEKTAVLWAAVQVPEIRAASQYFQKAEFSNASQIEALFKVSLIEQTVYLEGLSFLYHFRLPGPALSGWCQKGRTGGCGDPLQKRIITHAPLAFFLRLD